MTAEMLLQYLWEHRLWPDASLRTTDGRRVNVIDPGRRNNDAGPDFFNAKIEIGGDTWAGNVEVHSRASDWHRHGHHNDRAYDTIVLHVVGESDCDVTRPNGEVIPQVVLPYTTDYRARYDSLVGNQAMPPCAGDIASIPPLHLTDWICALGHERLYAKADRVLAAVDRLNGDWAAAVYVTVARALGFSTNADPFERLAYATPLRYLMKHRDDHPILEAMLLGQAGFLDTPHTGDVHTDMYLDLLRQDYAFVRAKYDLKPLDRSVWKMARMRPPNLPLRRIAALVEMVAGGFRAGSAFQSVTGIADARAMLDTTLTGYWATHYSFGPAVASSPRAFGDESLTLLLINAVIPVMYAYGLYFGMDHLMQTAAEMLQGLPAENNNVIRTFRACGIECPDAFTSQAMIQLRREYCDPRKCLYCRIGHRLLAARTRP